MAGAAMRKKDVVGVYCSEPCVVQKRRRIKLTLRIPTPVFGAGLIENIDETDLLAYRASLTGNSLGITPNFNRNGNDGTISRFGWKAQNKSLEISPARPTTWRWA